MLKPITIAALALTAIPALAQDAMMDIDAKTSSEKEIMAFIEKDAYKKLNAPDAYVVTSFLSGLPGNYRSALLRGIAGNVQEAREI